MLAAIDGHAKNFSVFLTAGGRTRMTPIYDILSAHPIVARNRLHRRELRMAMAVDGKNRHYRWEEISGRHWLTTAKKVRFPEKEAQTILRECAARGPDILRETRDHLPSGFPGDVAEPILRGVEDTLGRT